MENLDRKHKLFAVKFTLYNISFLKKHQLKAAGARGVFACLLYHLVLDTRAI